MFFVKKIFGYLLSPGVIILVILGSGLLKLTLANKSKKIRLGLNFPGNSVFLFFYHSIFAAGIIISPGKQI